MNFSLLYFLIDEKNSTLFSLQLMPPSEIQYISIEYHISNDNLQAYFFSYINII
jgi:hypothetical protein